MPFVRIEQRDAHLAGEVKLDHVNSKEGPLAKAVLVAISNTRVGLGDARRDEATAIQWTLWGKQAENAAEYLGKGSHVNVVGRVRNNNYDKDGETVYRMEFTVDELDYLETKEQADARRAREGEGGKPLAPPADDDAPFYALSTTSGGRRVAPPADRTPITPRGIHGHVSAVRQAKRVRL